MSCRSTHAGTLALRLARAYSSLPDRVVTSLFHALKREGADSAPPTADEMELLRFNLRAMADDAGLSTAQRERSERDLLLARDEAFDAGTFHALMNIEARARQESVLRSVKSQVVDLDEPGAHADFYQLGPDGRPTHVWYASYGSNLNRSRFLTYVQGGSPEGADVHHEGCRDTTPPTDDIAIRFSGRMHFAASSGRWDGGGIAFMDNDSAGHALGRAYQVTSQQFDDIVCQENGRSPGSLTVDMEDALKNGRTGITVGLYGDLVHIGDYAGSPVFTFTGSFSAADAVATARLSSKALRRTNTPSNNYVRMIGSGLAETFEMSVDEQADYLRGSLGLSQTSRDQVLEILTTPTEPSRPRPVTRAAQSASSSSTRERAYRDVWDSRSADIWGDSYETPWWEDDAPGYRTRYPGEQDQDDLFSDSDWYGTSRRYSTNDDPDTLFDIPEERFDPYHGVYRIYGRKRCSVCDSGDHDMHSCPLLEGQ